MIRSLRKFDSCGRAAFVRQTCGLSCWSCAVSPRPSYVLRSVRVVGMVFKVCCKRKANSIVLLPSTPHEVQLRPWPPLFPRTYRIPLRRNSSTVTVPTQSFRPLRSNERKNVPCASSLFGVIAMDVQGRGRRLRPVCVQVLSGACPVVAGFVRLQPSTFS